MRTFIAIDLPQGIKTSLAKLQNQLKRSSADVSWVQTQNIHLTLKFLGERGDKKIEKIMQILEETANNNKPFSARISCIGAFPKMDYPRIIWAGLDRGDNEVKRIVEELENKISTTGVPKEDKPFSSHVTIGRLRSGLNRGQLVKQLLESTELLMQEHLEFRVERITLFKSTLTSGGPIYEALKETILKTS